eukprot:2190195-Pyramimonas_sp.AAC.1
MKAVPFHVAQAVWKTLAAAWATSERMHSKTRSKCILGCDGRDTFKHYFSECPCFRQSWTRVIGYGLPSCPVA